MLLLFHYLSWLTVVNLKPFFLPGTPVSADSSSHRNMKLLIWLDICIYTYIKTLLPHKRRMMSSWGYNGLLTKFINNGRSHRFLPGTCNSLWRAWGLLGSSVFFFYNILRYIYYITYIYIYVSWMIVLFILNSSTSTRRHPAHPVSALIVHLRRVTACLNYFLE